MISTQLLVNILQVMLNVGLIASIVLLQRRVTRLEDRLNVSGLLLRDALTKSRNHGQSGGE